jgi:hypothetical protein
VLGLGPLVVAGPLASWIVGALEGVAVAGGLSALGAGLYSIGIPKDSILSYEAAIKSDKFLVVAHGTPDEVHKAKEILEGTSPKQMDVHGDDAR